MHCSMVRREIYKWVMLGGEPGSNPNVLYGMKYTYVYVGRTAMSEIQRITVDPNQCGGRPCLRGLRIRVRDVLDLLAAGATREEILADYPLLEAGDITAALEYAARQSDHPVLRVA
jgi:uncharacterized protein (DUF433 family)